MDDIIPASENPANQAPPDMSTMEGHEDSRTAVAGRKRDFEETTEIPITEGEPSRKRAREDEHTSSLEDGETSISPVLVLADETGDLSQLPSAQGSVFTMLKTDSEEGQGSVQAPTNAPRPPLTRTWNTGVHSGLRTSFGAKGKGKAILQPDQIGDPSSVQAKDNATPQTDGGDEIDGIIIELNDDSTDTKDQPKKKRRRNRDFQMDEYDTTDPFIDDSGLVLPTTKLSGPEEQHGPSFSAEPFQRLTSRQQKKLSREQRDIYKLERKGWLETQKAAKKAAEKSAKKAPLTSVGAPPLLAASSRDDSGDDVDESGSGSDEEDDDGRDQFYRADKHNPQVPSAISDEMLAAIGPAPVRPVFQMFSNYQKKQLSREERAEYIVKASEYSAALTRYGIAKREYDHKLGAPYRALPTNFEQNPQKIPREAVLELSDEDQKKYKEIHIAHERARLRAERDGYHLEAAAVLQKVKRWPLPTEFGHITALVKKGKTWYSSPIKSVRDYNCGSGTFPVTEFFDDDGIPIAIQEFTFNAFLMKYLMFAKTWDGLDRKVLKKVFNHYLLMYYPQANELHPLARLTIDAPGYISLASAKQEVRDRLGKINQSAANPPTAPMPADMATTEKRTAEQDTNSSFVRNSTTDVALQKDSVNVTMTDTTPAARAAEKAPIQGITIIDDDDVLAAHMLLQQKYYPSARKAIRCLTCSKIGHVSDTCPSLNCLTCGVQGQHSNVMCPRDISCGRCREHGHTQDDCQERLAMSRSEMTCDLCQAHSHIETECPQIWRTFGPTPEEILVVNEIPVHCYTCGGTGHYGPDCGMFSRGRILAGNHTWTKENLFKYLDPSSRYRAISAGVDYSLPPKPNKNHSYSIKGKANNPISLDSDDDDDVEFIRPSVLSGNAPRGNINFGRGQPPQAPFRGGGQGQISVSIRGPQGKRGRKNSGPPYEGRHQMNTKPGGRKPKKPKNGGRGGRPGEASERR